MASLRKPSVLAKSKHTDFPSPRGTLVVTIFLFLFNLSAWAKPLVLISYYDAFDKAAFNNSERVASKLSQILNQEESSFEVRLCGLSTIFDKAFEQTEDCLHNLPEKPILILGLGESTCELKVETMMRNLDKTYGPDNAGIERDYTTINPKAPWVVGLRYPLDEMYCALSESDRKTVDVSNNAGSFVCNNTAFQMTYQYPEINFGFIHIPSHNCPQLSYRTEETVRKLQIMLNAAVVSLSAEDAAALPVTRAQIRYRRKQHKYTCRGEFFERLKSANEIGTFLKVRTN